MAEAKPVEEDRSEAGRVTRQEAVRPSGRARTGERAEARRVFGEAVAALIVPEPAADWRAVVPKLWASFQEGQASLAASTRSSSDVAARKAVKAAIEDRAEKMGAAADPATGEPVPISSVMALLATPAEVSRALGFTKGRGRPPVLAEHQRTFAQEVAQIALDRGRGWTKKVEEAWERVRRAHETKRPTTRRAYHHQYRQEALRVTELWGRGADMSDAELKRLLAKVHDSIPSDPHLMREIAEAKSAARAAARRRIEARLDSPVRALRAAQAMLSSDDPLDALVAIATVTGRSTSQICREGWLAPVRERHSRGFVTLRYVMQGGAEPARRFPVLAPVPLVLTAAGRVWEAVGQGQEWPGPDAVEARAGELLGVRGPQDVLPEDRDAVEMLPRLYLAWAHRAFAHDADWGEHARSVLEEPSASAAAGIGPLPLAGEEEDEPTSEEARGLLDTKGALGPRRLRSGGAVAAAGARDPGSSDELDDGLSDGADAA